MSAFVAKPDIPRTSRSVRNHPKQICRRIAPESDETMAPVVRWSKQRKRTRRTNMKLALLAALLVVAIGFARVANAQDVQGMGSSTTGKATVGQSANVSSQENLRGEIATVDEASGKISVKLSGTVGSSDSTTPTFFKVQDGLIFNAVKPGDKISFTVEKVGEDMTIKTLTKD
jgi:Cu/Ag efflux protein CusF